MFFRWCGANGFVHAKCIMDTTVPQWFDPELFPPLAIYYGVEDYLVDAESLLQRLENKEKVKLMRVQKLEYEVSATHSSVRKRSYSLKDGLSIVIFI
jgi:lysosomal acid lipase/cholesteryl ester hydrolase